MQVRNLGKPVDLAGQYYKDGADEVYFHSLCSRCNVMLMAPRHLYLDLVWHLTMLLVGFQISFLNITGFRDFPLGDLPMIQVPLLLFFLLEFKCHFRIFPVISDLDRYPCFIGVEVHIRECLCTTNCWRWD